MKLKLGMISLWVCMFFISCYEDKGNYDLVDYNRVLSIYQNSALSRTTVSLGDTVRVVPLITWKYPDQDTLTGFEYVWKTTWTGDTLSRERNLKYVPSRAGTFEVYLYMLEKATGVVSMQVWSVRVNSLYLSGWVVASNINNQPSLSYIRRDSRRDENNNIIYYWTDFIDIYAKLHGGTLGANKMLRAVAYSNDKESDEIMVFQDGGKATVLNGTDFSKRMNLSDEFPGAVYPAGFVPKDFVRGGWCDFVLGEKGDVYWRKNRGGSQMQHEVAFMDVPIYFTGGGAEVSNFFDIRVYGANLVLMYDPSHKRFLACYTNWNADNENLGRKLDIINNSNPAEFANILNLEGYKLLYCGDVGDGASYMNILKDESTGKYVYESYYLFNDGRTLLMYPVGQKEFSGGEYITDNSVFWRLRKSAYLYFGEGSKLYFYDTNTGRVKLYADFGAGRITHLMEDVECKRMGVALDNGTFYLCDAVTPAILAAENPGESGILHRVDGLGEIVSLSWKWGGYHGYLFQYYP